MTFNALVRDREAAEESLLDYSADLALICSSGCSAIEIVWKVVEKGGVKEDGEKEQTGEADPEEDAEHSCRIQAAVPMYPHCAASWEGRVPPRPYSNSKSWRERPFATGPRSRSSPCASCRSARCRTTSMPSSRGSPRRCGAGI